MSISSPDLHFLGFDVSKASLDLGCNSLGRKHKVPPKILNQPADIHRLVDKLERHPELGGPGLPRLQVICEPSGGYERELLEALWERGVKVSLVNAKRVKDHRGSRGKLAKTDALDAALLADYGQRHQPEPTPPPPEAQRVLRRLVDRRAQLVETRSQQTCQLKQLRDPGLIAGAKQLIELLCAQILQLEGLMDKAISANEILATKAKLLRAVKGVGPVVSATLLVHMPELGRLNRRQASALAGVAPVPCESGQWKGRRFIQGGRAQIRRVLYMAAVTSTRHPSTLQGFYNKLIAKGKPKKLALVALMNKLVKILNAILKNQFFANQIPALAA